MGAQRSSEWRVEEEPMEVGQTRQYIIAIPHGGHAFCLLSSRAPPRPRKAAAIGKKCVHSAFLDSASEDKRN